MRQKEEKLGKQEGSNGFVGKLEPLSWLTSTLYYYIILYLGCSDLLQINDHKRAMVDLLLFTILYPILL
jgi:hypothetical protein